MVFREILHINASISTGLLSLNILPLMVIILYITMFYLACLICSVTNINPLREMKVSRPQHLK